MVGVMVLALVASSAWAQEQEQGRTFTLEGMEGHRLTLAESLRIALEQNLDLVSARVDPAIAEQNITAVDATFDPTLFSSPFHRESEQEISNLSSLSSFESDSMNVGVEDLFKFGGAGRVDFEGRRDLASGPFVTSETTYTSGLAMSFTQPLLKGFGTEVTTEQLVLREGDLEISREQLRVSAHGVLERVEGGYWDLLAAYAALDVSKQALERAQDLLGLNRKKVEVGTLAPIEITQAEAGVASEEENVIIAETNLENAADELRRLLAVPEGDPLWNERLLPVDSPPVEVGAIDLEAAIDTAMAQRPELLNARQVLRNTELSERVAKRLLRPELELAAALTPSGNNFEVNPGFDGIPGTTDDQFGAEGQLGEAIQEIPEFDNYDWSLGLNFRYPVGNRAAKSSYSIASLSRQKAEIGVSNQEQTIRVEVRTAVRAVESGMKRIDAAQKNVELQREKLEAEQKRFDNGMSTSFEVLTFQNDLSNAQLRLINARLDFVKAVTALERVKGTLLESRGLDLAMAE
jgi:outer membrane protein TolC